MKNTQNIVVRFAPSPTGYLHIGGARTALFNYLFTRKNGGKFILRIEDTDKERSEEKYEKSIIDTLNWLGLEHDEKFKQSERTDLYKYYLKKMIDSGDAYVSEEKLSEEDASSGKRPSVIRFKNPNKKIKFNDLVLGEIEFDTTELEDFVIAKDIETPLYHLTAVVDDFEMGITHVIRGQEHISNTPRQICIQEAIGATSPIYVHIPLILNEDKSKLSKRDGAVNVIEYEKLGYLPEALLNYLAFLGWNPGDDREILCKEDLIKEFDLLKVQKGGAVFNVEKLNWINKKYISQMSEEGLENKVEKFLPKEIKEYPHYKDVLKKLLPIIRERIDKFSDLEEMHKAGELYYFFEKPKYNKEKLIWKDESVENTKKHLEKAIELIHEIPDNNFTTESIKEKVWNYATEQGRGNVLWPMRYALSGLEKSPDPFIIASISGKAETIERLELGMNHL